MSSYNAARRAMRPTLVELFGIDPRTLALARTSAAVVLLYNLATRAADLQVMYSDQGMFPTADVARYWGVGSWRWSLHMLQGDVTYQGVLFAIAAAFAIMLLMGFMTRTSTVASWALLLSLHNRAPALVTGGDVLLLMLLFWGMFLPWGRRFSLDAWLRRSGPSHEPVLSVASAAVLVQVAFMYLFTGFSKCNFLWFEGRALESVFLNPLFTRPLGVWLAQFPQILQLLTYATLVLELLGPLLLFSPWKTRTVRSWVVACFMLLHVGIEATMYVVIFSQASLAALTHFIPSSFWSSALMRRITHRFPHGDPARATALAPASVPRSATLTAWVTSVFCGLALMYVLTVNPWAYFASPTVQARIPRALVRVDEVLGLGQQWSMFACPAIHDYRYVAVADLRNGTTVDVLRNQVFVGDERPQQLSLETPSQRWVQLMVDLPRPGRDVVRESVTRYLARQWNAKHGPSEQIEHVQLGLIFEEPRTQSAEMPTRQLVLARVDPHAHGTYRQGLRHGSWTYYYPNGQKEAVGRYQDGVEQGPWTLWYDDGRLQGQGTYVGGRMHGKWLFCYASGEKVEAHFDHGAIVPHPLPPAESDNSGSEPAGSVPGSGEDEGDTQ